jgi:hypothetical protein
MNLPLTGSHLLKIESVNNPNKYSESGHKSVDDYVKELLNYKCFFARSKNVINKFGKAEIRYLIGKIEDYNNSNCSRHWQKDDDRIKTDGTWVWVFFDDICYAQISKGRKALYIVETVNINNAMKDRLNRILMRFCGVKLFKKNHNFFIATPFMSDVEIVKNMKIPFHNNQYLPVS